MKEEFDTGSVRDTQIGKSRPDLIPDSTLLRLGNHYAAGAEHYGENNWRKGQPITRYIASMKRHMHKFLTGETDEEHLIAMIWNAIAIDWTLEAIEKGWLPKELDDRGVWHKPNVL